MASSGINISPAEVIDTLSPFDLAFMIAEGNANENYTKKLESSLDISMIDITDNDGRTPLMVACRIGSVDAVKFFLDKGADPNLQCKKGNTSLHYACSLERGSLPLTWQVNSKKDIVQSLLDNGAAIKHNLDGLSPCLTAAFFGKEDLVNLFLSSDKLDCTVEEKIRATELLGVSQSLHGSIPQYMAVDTFCRALGLKNQSSSADIPERNQSEFEKCFSLSGKQECNSVETMQAIGNEESAIKAHAFMVGDRVLPQRLKKIYYLPRLLNYAKDCLYKRKNPNEGFHLFKHLLNLEKQAYLEFGSVLKYIAEGIDWHGDNDIHVLQYTRDLLQSYSGTVEEVEGNVLISLSDQLKEKFATILFNLAFNCSQPVILASCLSSVERMLCNIEKLLPGSDRGEQSRTFSTVHFILGMLGEEYVERYYGGVSSGSLKRVRHIICTLLKYDDITHKDERGQTVLHILMACVPVARDLDYIKSLARILIHHGCPLDLEDNEGFIPKDFLLDYLDQVDDELLAMVSPSTTPLPLEEIASRCLLRHKVPYRHILPRGLCEVVEGGGLRCDVSQLTTSDSEADFEGSSDEEADYQ